MQPLLEIENLHVRFATDEGTVHAVDGVSLAVARGEILGLVGESGCGKSATAMAVPQLLPTPPASVSADAIRFDGRDLLGISAKELCALRGRRIGVIFQDPMASLSPLHAIGDQLDEVQFLHLRVSRAAARARSLEWLAKVGIRSPAECAAALPHQLSGGMQQRVMIAMALMLDPDLVIADEPTTALDVTIQAQVLELMLNLHRRDSALLLITHDMGVVRRMCTHVAVMYAGRIVESAPAKELFASPLHPYTRALLAAMPSLRTRGTRLPTIPGQVPSALDFPPGCRFHPRCPRATASCSAADPAIREAAPSHFVRCSA